MAVQDYKINYKSDFVLTINGDAGWATQFCIKFWTGMPSQAYFVGFDGVKYVNCRVGDTPTQLLVMFDDHHLPIGPLRMQIAYHTTIEEFPGSVFDEVTNARDVIVTIDGTDYQVMLDFTGEDSPELEFNLPAYANEAERIQNELQRQQNEADRIAAELQREQATTAAVQGAENVNAQLAGNILTVTNRNGVSTSVNTKGEQGEQGPVGPQGPQGEQGVSIVSFRQVYASETATYYSIAFSDGHEQSVPIPKGAKGDTGATGPTGPQGPQGDTGVSITGFVETGETETATLYNITFSDGTTQAVAIPKGEKGDTGDQGPVGPQGPQGPMGDVAVITPEQQAAFTMYSTTGQNTDGPMTQKAVTDALDVLYKPTSEQETNITNTITWTNGYNIWAEPNTSTPIGALHETSRGMRASNFIDVSQYDKITLTMPTSIGNVSIGMAFYASADESSVVSAERVSGEGTGIPFTYVLKTYNIPEGANYIRCTQIASGDDFSLSVIKILDEATGLVPENQQDIAEINEKINNTEFEIAEIVKDDLTGNITWISGYNIWAKDNGQNPIGLHQTTAPQSATDYVSISNYNKVELTMPTNSGDVAVGIAFYANNNESSVVSSEYVEHEGISNWHYTVRTYDIPEGANYIRCTKLNNVSGFYLKGIDTSGMATIKGYKAAIDYLIGEQSKQSALNIKSYGVKGDGVTDDTAAIQEALDNGGAIYFPAGTYLVNSTLVIKDGTCIQGDGFDKTVIKAANGANLVGVAWRGTVGASTTHSTLYPIIRTEENSNGIIMQGIGVYDNGAYTSGNGKTRVGILPYYTQGMSVVDCGSSHINWLDPASGTMDYYAECAGFGLYVFNASNVRICGGHYEYGGYESCGVENSHDVYFNECFIGSGWRCAFQVHRDAYNVHLDHCTVVQNIALNNGNRFTSAAVILDGRSVDGLHDIFIDNNHIYGNVVTEQRGGGVKAVLGNEYNVFVRGNYIETNYCGIADQEQTASGFFNPKNWIITDNMIKAAYGVYHRRMNGIIVKNNIINATTNAITVNSDAYIVHDNILLDNTTITLSGTDVSN